MVRALKRPGRFPDRTLYDIRHGVIAGSDRIWYG